MTGQTKKSNLASGEPCWYSFKLVIGNDSKKWKAVYKKGHSFCYFFLNDKN